MVFPLWSPLVVFILVVLLFFSDLLTIFVTSRLMTVVLSSWPNSKFVNLSFVLLVCMLQIEIWRELNFFCYASSAIDPSIPTVVCSDFNAVMDWSLDRLGSSTFNISQESCDVLSALFYNCAVFDAWRYLHSDTGFFVVSSRRTNFVTNRPLRLSVLMASCVEVLWVGTVSVLGPFGPRHVFPGSHPFSKGS